MIEAIVDSEKFVEFEIMRLPSGIELDPIVLDSLVEKCTHLKELTVASMRETGDGARQALVNMTVQILAQSGPQLTGLYLSDLGCSAREGSKLLEALNDNLSLVKITDLSLFQNPLWFNGEDEG